ncbi:P-loop NTPase fold protein [Erysipelothrix rhusiopathiae]|nr:P-loop NTPase fold protein [Erysipelothrix rhusiopathiae]
MESRQEFVNTFIKYLISDDVKNEHILLNGKWGSGKTYTINKIKEILGENDDVDVIYFNSWKYDYHNYPQFALVESILDQIAKEDRSGQIELNFLETAEEIAKPNNSFSMKKALLSTLGSLLNIELSEFMTTEDFSKVAANNAYSKIVEENIFATALSYLIEKRFNRKKIIVFIDELDRVKPDFCIKTIEFFHHLSLENKNIVVVYAADLDALISLIDHFYGFGNKSIDYIEKVVQSIFNLPGLNNRDYMDYILEYCKVDELRLKRTPQFGRYQLELFSEVLSQQEIPLRTVQLLTREIIVKDLSTLHTRSLLSSAYRIDELEHKFENSIRAIGLSDETIHIESIKFIHCINIFYILKYIQLTDSDYKLTLRDEKKIIDLSRKVFEIQSIILTVEGSNFRQKGQLLWVKQEGHISDDGLKPYINDVIARIENLSAKSELSTIYEIIKIIFSLDNERKILR